MSRREKLLASIIGPDMDTEKAQMLDTTIKFILGDMGQQYMKMWEYEGPGVMVFQPQNKERSMFFLTLKEIHAAQEECEGKNDGDVQKAVVSWLLQEIDPTEKAGYIINDAD